MQAVYYIYQKRCSGLTVDYEEYFKVDLHFDLWMKIEVRMCYSTTKIKGMKYNTGMVKPTHHKTDTLTLINKTIVCFV